LGHKMLILSHFCEIAKFNLILLNLSSDVLDNNLPIVSERILNSKRVIVHQNKQIADSSNFNDNMYFFSIRPEWHLQEQTRFLQITK